MCVSSLLYIFFTRFLFFFIFSPVSRDSSLLYVSFSFVLFFLSVSGDYMVLQLLVHVLIFLSGNRQPTLSDL